jgi:hypothetical protein
MAERRGYVSYLLRLWEESEGSPASDPLGEPPLWRVSLESPQTHTVKAFASLEELFAFLRGQTRSGSPGLERGDAEESQALARRQ